MRKKQLACLSLLLCLLLLAGCGGGKTDKNTNEKSYRFVAGSVEIVVGEKMVPVLTALQSQNPQISATGSCLADVAGEDVLYRFSGFMIQTFRLRQGDENEQIRVLTLTDDSVSTPEGISIGATVAAVTEAYGSPSEQTDSRILYAGKGMRLVFGLRDGTVTSIVYEVID